MPQPRVDARTEMALDLEDLAHMTGRSDVSEDMWARVCQGRFREWPPSRLTKKRALERWKARARRMRLSMRLVNQYGEPAGERGRNLYDDSAALMRFDWPNVLRWTKRVLG